MVGRLLQVLLRSPEEVVIEGFVPALEALLLGQRVRFRVVFDVPLLEVVEGMERLPPPPGGLACLASSAGYGSSVSKRTVRSSILIARVICGIQFQVVTLSFQCASSYMNTKSSAVSGWPSDHLRPSRR